MEDLPLYEVIECEVIECEVIEVNYGTQRITVTSYRLGSKYDRLM